MYSLECCPDEISLLILNLLRKHDLQTCRLVSSLMRDKIDRLFNHQWCIYLTEKTQDDFVIKTKNKKKMSQAGKRLLPNFLHMKVGNVTYFSKNHIMKRHSFCFKKYMRLREDYFESITELEFTGAIRKNYFHQIIKLSGHLQILRLSSAVIGGTANLFRSEKTSDSLESASSVLSKIQGGKSISLCGLAILTLFEGGRRKLRKNIDGSSSCFCNNDSNSENNTCEKLVELHIKLDYVSPSTPHFSLFLLVQNLRDLRSWPVRNLKVFSVIVDESKDGEMFYFTIPLLLNLIPVKAFESLNTAFIQAPKCRQEKIQLGESREIMKYDHFENMQLEQFRLNICRGYNHPIPDELTLLLRSQKKLKHAWLSGFPESESPLVQ